jgi:alpha-glutamyl/putrescinyl thymine pyrophosphorylase clade 1
MTDGLPRRLRDVSSMGKAFELLRSYPTVGDFLAYQYVTDLNYSTLTNFSEMEFVVPGPGSRNGIRKCFSDLGGLSEAEIIKVVTDRQEKEFERLGLKFKSLWGRKLQLIDCQNLFCEVDKYARLRHPEFTGNNGRKRIKQKFRPKKSSIDYWYPPKWNLNSRMLEN